MKALLRSKGSQSPFFSFFHTVGSGSPVGPTMAPAYAGEPPPQKKRNVVNRVLVGCLGLAARVPCLPGPRLKSRPSEGLAQSMRRGAYRGEGDAQGDDDQGPEGAIGEALPEEREGQGR